jgi:signal transduction histidine kinase
VETSKAAETSFEHRQPRFFQSLVWVIIGMLVVVELVFGLVVEPWADASGGWLGVFFDRYAWLLRFGILATVVWLTFNQLARVEAILLRQRDRIRSLYEESRDRHEELSTLYEASLEMSREGDYREILRAIVEIAARLAHARYGALAEFDDSERVVEFVTVGVEPGVAAHIGLPPTHRGLLARLSAHDAVRIDDIASEPDVAGFPEGHPQLRAFLGVPVRFESELLGHLYLADPEQGRFSDRHAHMLGLFAYQAAVAIGRARVDRERSELLRTEEQRRVASELHDGALQALYAVGIQLQRARRRGVRELTDTMTTSNAIAAVERAMAAIRGELYLLSDRPVTASAWEQLNKHVADVATLYGVGMVWKRGGVPALSRGVASALASVLAELVANAARHGGADRVEVEVSCVEDRLELHVADDGSGVPDGAALIEGNGLSGARRRLAQVGGDLALVLGSRGFGAHIVVPVGSGPPDPSKASRATGEMAEG